MTIHTQQEIIKKSNEIIDSLIDFEPQEKYHIVWSLHESLKDLLTKMGYDYITIEKGLRGTK